MLVGSALMAWLWRASSASLPAFAVFNGLLDVATVSHGTALTLVGILALSRQRGPAQLQPASPSADL